MVLQKIETINFPMIGDCKFDFEDYDGTYSITLPDKSLVNTYICYPNSANSSNKNIYVLSYDNLFRFINNILHLPEDIFEMFDTGATLNIQFRSSNVSNIYWYSCLISNKGFITQRLHCKKGKDSDWELVDEENTIQFRTLGELQKVWGAVIYIANEDIGIDLSQHGLRTAQSKLMKSSYGEAVELIYEACKNNVVKSLLVQGLRTTSSMITDITPIASDSDDYIYRLHITSGSKGRLRLIQDPNYKELITIMILCLSKITGILAIVNRLEDSFPKNNALSITIQRCLYLSREGFKNNTPVSQRILHFSDKNIIPNDKDRFLPARIPSSN